MLSPYSQIHYMIIQNTYIDKTHKKSAMLKTRFCAASLQLACMDTVIGRILTI